MNVFLLFPRCSLLDSFGVHVFLCFLSHYAIASSCLWSRGGPPAGRRRTRLCSAGTALLRAQRSAAFLQFLIVYGFLSGASSWSIFHRMGVSSLGFHHRAWEDVPWKRFIFGETLKMLCCAGWEPFLELLCLLLDGFSEFSYIR